MDEYKDKMFITLNDISESLEKEIFRPHKIAIKMLDDIVRSFEFTKACNGQYVDRPEFDWIDMRKYGIKERIKTNNYCKYGFRCIHQENLELSNFTKLRICKFY